MVHYANGTADTNGYYSGIAIADENALLTSIKDNLVTAGFTLVSDDIVASSSFNIKGTETNGDECNLSFSTTTVSGINKKLSIVGDKDGTGTLLSPAVELDFVADGQSVIYLTADASAGCLFILNPAATSESSHFGYLNRRNTANPYVWMVGKLDEWMTGAYLAEGAISGETWVEIKDYYYSSTESFTSPNGAYQYLWDSLTTGVAANTKTTSNATGFGYKPWLGAIDPVLARPILGPYGYLEGYGDSNDYPVNASAATALHFPGEVKFARTGMASLAPAVQPKEGTKTFISGGAAGQYQGFQISD